MLANAFSPQKVGRISSPVQRQQQKERPTELSFWKKTYLFKTLVVSHAKSNDNKEENTNDEDEDELSSAKQQPRQRPAQRQRRQKQQQQRTNSNDNPDDTKSRMDPAKRAALDGVLNHLERSYGRGSVIRLGAEENRGVSGIGTGSLTLDVALGKGYPRGRIIEIYGAESSGKTTLALHAIAQAQAQGGIAAFIDAEHALDISYARNCGVNTQELLLTQPDSGEMALDVVDQLVRSAAVDVIVVDSVAALVPRAELEGDMSDAQIGLQARLMSKALRKITGSLSLSQCTVIFLNQLRQKVGVIYGSPEVTAGGNALKFYATIRLDTRRKEILPENAGIRIQVKVVKNKVAPPFRLVGMDILFGKGIDSLGCTIDAALELGILERRGSWYSFKGQSNLAQGKQNLVALLKENRDLATQLETTVRQGLSKDGLDTADDEELQLGSNEEQADDADETSSDISSMESSTWAFSKRSNPELE